jgi:hypothetical protein
MTEAVSWTWPSIIDALGGTGAVADALSDWKSTVSGWRKRGIPSARWASIVRLANDKGESGITLEVLADLAERRPADLVEARA